jgi:hypothetical protein
MPTPKCSRCNRPIAGEDINVANDVAYCRSCNLSFSLSDLTHGGLDAEVNLNNPPSGAWCQSDGSGTVVGATHRSLGTSVGALAVGLFWNGIVSMFVLLNLSSTMRLLHIPVPEWFPAPKMNGDTMSVGMTLFLWLFLTPFIAVGLAMVGAFASALAGRTEVRLGNADGSVFTGIGALGLRRRFVPSEVKDVRIDDRQWRDNDGDRRRRTCIVLETRPGKRIRFGTMLTEERRSFVAAAVRQKLPL